MRSSRSLFVRSSVGFLVAALSVAIIGWGFLRSSTASGASSAGHKVTIAMLAGLANPFQSDVLSGVQSIAKADNATVKYYNYNDDSLTEASDVSDIIVSKPDLVLYGVSNSSVSLANFKRLKQAGIPVVCFDVCLEPNVEKTYAHGFVTSNNQYIGNITGTLAATYIKQKLKGSATVAFITCNTESVCQTRFAAQQAALKAVKVMEVANEVEIDPSAAQSAAEDILVAHKGLDMIITDGLSETEAAAAAVSDLKDHTVVFGMDITPSIARDLLAPDGPLQAAVGQNGVKIGQLAATIGLGVLAGKNPATWQVTVPGKLYLRSDPAGVKAYLTSEGAKA